MKNCDFTFTMTQRFQRIRLYIFRKDRKVYVRSNYHLGEEFSVVDLQYHNVLCDHHVRE